jgi:hypothetical protein
LYSIRKQKTPIITTKKILTYLKDFDYREVFWSFLFAILLLFAGFGGGAFLNFSLIYEFSRDNYFLSKENFHQKKALESQRELIDNQKRLLDLLLEKSTKREKEEIPQRPKEEDTKI